MRRQTPYFEENPYELESITSDEQPEALADALPVRKAMAALPELQAHVLRKSYFEGLSHSEIAAELDIPLGSVKSNIRLAFKKLRSSLRSEL